ncbi:hypothetical protein R3P38DRAFT_3345932 [Favolaschia claudopus]|uniref:Ndc10 domain-containing protein n=1 Tax=Favolaschia claudopus TaxID=2862362 RepID=A0AAW0DEJ0_9AGAR
MWDHQDPLVTPPVTGGDLGPRSPPLIHDVHEGPGYPDAAKIRATGICCHHQSSQLGPPVRLSILASPELDDDNDAPPSPQRTSVGYFKASCAATQSLQLSGAYKLAPETAPLLSIRMVAKVQKKEMRIIAYHGPPTALAAKSRRFHSSSLTTITLPPIPDPPYRFNSMEQVVDCEPTSIMPPTRESPRLHSPEASIEPGSGYQSSYEALEAESQLLRQTFVQQNQEGKSTGETYKRHYNNYIFWFDSRETLRVQNDPSYQRIPALPITVAKVVLFLNYEMTRPQKRKLADNMQSTSTCGIEHAKQVVSALEHYRFDTQHLYRHIPEAQVSLRTDNRIKTLEEAFAHNEPERTKKAHSLKTAGTRADTYTDDQLTQLATSGLDSKGPMKIWRAMRDRAMMLTSSTTAFRGDNSRLLVWSDMYCYDVPMHAKGHGTKLRALTLIADNSKQNQSGRVDEHGAFRHFVVELCPVGAIGLLFFALFHVINSPVPNFEVNFSDPAYGDFGKREWYELFTFSSSKDCRQEMSYANHRERVKNLHEKNNVSISKVTHAGRGYTAKTARENGASSAEVKALGGWSDSGSYRACYDRALPLRAMLAAAMFDSEHPETHFLARDSLQPPPAVLALIFPWVEDELKKLDTREAANRMARDIALRHFLGLLIWLRTVIVQDAAVLYTRHPSAAIFQYPPFNSSTFRTFAAQSASVIAKAEKDVALALESLPQNIANTFTAAMSRLAIDQEIERQANQTYQDDLKSQLTVLQDLIEHNGSRTKKKRKTDGYSDYKSPEHTRNGIRRRRIVPDRCAHSDQRVLIVVDDEDVFPYGYSSSPTSAKRGKDLLEGMRRRALGTLQDESEQHRLASSEAARLASARWVVTARRAPSATRRHRSAHRAQSQPVRREARASWRAARSISRGAPALGSGWEAACRHALTRSTARQQPTTLEFQHPPAVGHSSSRGRIDMEAAERAAVTDVAVHASVRRGEWDEWAAERREGLVVWRGTW